MTITEATPDVAHGAEYDQAHATLKAALAPMEAKHGVEYVLGYVTSYVAGRRGLTEDLVDLLAYSTPDTSA